MDRYIELHKEPEGPGDNRPTALQIIEIEGITGKWSDKTILITGTSAGIGVETAKALATTSAHLYLTARDLTKARKALGSLVNSPQVHLLELDLNSLASVRSCVTAFRAKTSQLDVLICNAGVMNTPEGRTADGFETQLGVNHLAHFLLINLLLPTLVASSTPDFNSRVVILSSLGHRFGSIDFDNLNLEGEGAYEPNKAYAQSKLANIWTANQLEHLYGGEGLHAWSVHPGAIKTELGRYLSREEGEALLKIEELKKMFKSVEQGASTTVWSAVAKSLEGEGGRFLEDCQVAEEWKEEAGMFGPGHGKLAYDKTGEERLWQVSRELVGLESTET